MKTLDEHSVLANLEKLAMRQANTQQTIPEGWQLVPKEPTEEEIEAPRYFFQALELGLKNIQDIRKHLEQCGVDTSTMPDFFRNETGHLTKAGKALVVRALMLAAAPKPEE